MQPPSRAVHSRFGFWVSFSAVLLCRCSVALAAVRPSVPCAVRRGGAPRLERGGNVKRKNGSRRPETPVAVHAGCWMLQSHVRTGAHSVVLRCARAGTFLSSERRPRRVTRLTPPKRKT